MEFETIGYFLEYSVGGKFIGCINIEQPDRERVGWHSTMNHVADRDIILNNKKRIKKGQEYTTRLYPLNGRIKNN